MAVADPTSPWQPTSAPEMLALCFDQPADGRGRHEEPPPPLLGRADAMVAVVSAAPRGTDARRAIGRRGHDAAPPRPFSSFTAMA